MELPLPGHYGSLTDEAGEPGNAGASHTRERTSHARDKVFKGATLHP